MTRSHAYRIAAAALGAAIAGTVVSAAHAEYRRAPISHSVLKAAKGPTLQLLYKFGCQAQGTPVEFPNDIVIVNKSAHAIPAGTKVKWKMVSMNVSGIKVLPNLAPGAHVFIANAVPGGIPAGSACTVQKI